MKTMECFPLWILHKFFGGYHNVCRSIFEFSLPNRVLFNRHRILIIGMDSSFVVIHPRLNMMAVSVFPVSIKSGQRLRVYSTGIMKNSWRLLLQTRLCCSSMRFHPHRPWLAYASTTACEMIDACTGRLVDAVQHEVGQHIVDVSFDYSGDILATCCSKEVRLWNWDGTGYMLLHTIQPERFVYLNDVRFHPFERKFVVRSSVQGSRIALWTLSDSGRLSKRYLNIRGGAPSAFSSFFWSLLFHPSKPELYFLCGGSMTSLDLNTNTMKFVPPPYICYGRWVRRFGEKKYRLYYRSGSSVCHMDDNASNWASDLASTAPAAIDPRGRYAVQSLNSNLIIYRLH